MIRILSYFLLLVTEVYSHGRLTFPVPRLKNVSGGLNAPIYTCLGPAFGTSATSMRCHDTPATNILTTINAGTTIQIELLMEAPHPGDCSLWISYDTNVNSPQNWIKLKNYPACFSVNGIDTFIGRKTVDVYIPPELPSCEHCVLRWEWYSVQQVSNVEFYVNCLDIAIINNFNNNCDKPSPTTVINGIEHLLYNLEDQTQKGCPFYNVYDVNIAPPVNKRSRGPKEWVPTCVNNPVPQPTTPVQIITYPCSNINCGLFGTCNNGNCICRNGYTGTLCEISPTIQCDINCVSLNRKTCSSINTCGNCLTGFTGQLTGNTLCNVLCNVNCGSLNRRSCVSPNICGVCLPNFSEPVSQNKMQSCIPITPVNGMALSITSQWVNGFCGKWNTICPTTRDITFTIPNNLVDIRGWNIINMKKIGNVMTGKCPTWSNIGQKTYGGFCASFPNGQKVVVSNNGFYIRNMRKLGVSNNLSYYPEYQNVSIHMTINNNGQDLTPEQYDYLENDLKVGSYTTGDVKILNSVVNPERNGRDISIKIICDSRVDFDGALFVHMNNIGGDLQIDQNLFYTDPISEIIDTDKLNGSNRININFSMLFLVLIMNFLK